MATKPCIRCGYYPEEKDQFCIRCGAPLKNKCTNDGGLLGDPCQKVNPPDAAFCAHCGSPTLFKKEGLLINIYPETDREENEWDSFQLFNRPFFYSAD